MATSMTAPSDAIRIPLTNNPLMWISRSSDRSTSSSASDILKPFSGEITQNSAANRPAAATPPTHPSVAQSVFLLIPVRSSSEAPVVSTTIRMVIQTGSAPRRIIGT